MEYKNEMDRVPHALGKDGRQPPMTGCNDFKSEASDQAYGACGKEGSMKDQKLIHAQMPYQYSDVGY
jgi:hypothetical protein